MKTILLQDVIDGFDALIEAIEHEPVSVLKAQEPVAIVLSPQHYDRLLPRGKPIDRMELERLMANSIVRHGSIYKALARWEADNEPPDGDSPAQS